MREAGLMDGSTFKTMGPLESKLVNSPMYRPAEDEFHREMARWADREQVRINKEYPRR